LLSRLYQVRHSVSELFVRECRVAGDHHWTSALCFFCPPTTK
jgi:hypothetical protein